MPFLLVQLLTTLPMAGLIWFVQVVHYPLFAYAGSPSFASAHATRTTYVVAPLMLLELLSSVVLLRAGWRPLCVSANQAWLGAALVGVVWLSTAFMQVPLHTRLQARHNRADAERLVRTNWVRTLAWSARAALLAVWIVRCGTLASTSLK